MAYASQEFYTWQSVYYYFCKLKNEGVIEELLDIIRAKVRKISGREESPTTLFSDTCPPCLFLGYQPLQIKKLFKFMSLKFL